MWIPATHLKAALVLLVLGLVAAQSGVAAAAPPKLSLAAAEQATREALVGLPIEGVMCVRPSHGSRRAARRAAVCLVAHPATEGRICRSLVSVRRVGAEARARVRRLNACQVYVEP